VLGFGAGDQEVLEDTTGASHAGKVFFGSGCTGIDDSRVSSILASASSLLKAENPCVETVQ
jgi:hypothetical protein